MAERKPLIIKDGRVEEMPSGDTISTDIAPGSGGGGSSDFVSLTDTPANFTGQALQFLRVNATEDALEYVAPPADGSDGAPGADGTDGTDGQGVPVGGTTGQVLAKIDGTDYNTEWTTPSGGGDSGELTQLYLPDNFANTGYTVSVSATSAATKGNRIICAYDVDLKTVQFQGNEATSETYEVVIAELSSLTVGTVIGRTTTTSVGGTDEFIDFTFSTPLRLVAGQNYLILVTQQGGTGTTALDCHVAENGLTGVISTYAVGGYITDNDIQGGETFSVFGSTIVGMQLTFDVVFSGDGVGSGILSGTVDPTTEGKDGDFYYRTDTYTIFGPKSAGVWPAGTSLVGPEGPAGSSAMVQTEITSTAYSTVSADFAGNVVRRMNNAAAQTITVEPSMANGEPVTFIATGAGAVSFAAGTGVTIHSADGNLTIAAQYGSATLVPDATTAETYYLIGNLTT